MGIGGIASAKKKETRVRTERRHSLEPTMRFELTETELRRLSFRKHTLNMTEIEAFNDEK